MWDPPDLQKSPILDAFPILKQILSDYNESSNNKSWVFDFYRFYLL